MQSIASPRVDFIRELQGQFVDTPDGLADSIPWRVNRANDFQCLAQIAFCIGNLPAQAHYSVPALSAWLREQEKPSGGFKSQVRNALTEMFHLATTPELDAVFTSITQRVAPVEFVFLGEFRVASRAGAYGDPVPYRSYTSLPHGRRFHARRTG